MVGKKRKNNISVHFSAILISNSHISQLIVRRRNIAVFGISKQILFWSKITLLFQV